MADSWNQRLQRGLNRALHPLGLHLIRKERAFEMEGVLARAAQRGMQIGSWIDVGASDGTWSLHARTHFPKAKFLLFEPLHERRAALDALRERYGFEIVSAAAGAAPGTIAFNVDPDLDGSGVASAGSADARIVPVESIDNAVAARALPAPYGLKLDTHGHELAVLAGAAAVLERAELLIIEAYAFRLTSECLRFHELCAWLEVRGFRCCDLADPMRRPLDGALWQMDFAFIRASHPMFESSEYR